MSEIITVYAIIEPDRNKIVEVCSTKVLAKEAAPAWDDWHGHGSAEVVERQAVKVGDRLYLIANDHGPEIKLDSTGPAKEAVLRINARSKLTDDEAKALGLKK